MPNRKAPQSKHRTVLKGLSWARLTGLATRLSAASTRCPCVGPRASRLQLSPATLTSVPAGAFLSLETIYFVPIKAAQFLPVPWLLRPDPRPALGPTGRAVTDRPVPAPAWLTSPQPRPPDPLLSPACRLRCLHGEAHTHTSQQCALQQPGRDSHTSTQHENVSTVAPRCSINTYNP